MSPGAVVSLDLVGLNHKTCPVQTRERLAGLRTAVVREGLRVAGWREVIVLSTCNRFEVYASGPPEGCSGPDALAQALDQAAGGGVAEHLYRLSSGEAVAHLFDVAAGLDSLVIGECEILAQVKKAYEDSQRAECTDKITNVAFQRALFVGKAVRSSTQISMGQLSTASVAVELAKRIFGSLEGSGVLVLGAGEIAEKTARHLKSVKVGGLHIANRTWERACSLASRLAADPVRWEGFDRMLTQVDIVISSTASSEPILTRDRVARALEKRGGRSLFLIDLAMPRDIETSVETVDGAYLYRIEDLQAIADENAVKRRGGLDEAREIVSRESRTFAAWLDSLGSGHEIALRHSQLRPHRRPAGPLHAV